MFEFLDESLPSGSAMTYKHWLVVLIIVFGIAWFITWLANPPEAPTIVEGEIEGIYDARYEYFYWEPMTSRRFQGCKMCFNQSHIDFWGVMKVEGEFSYEEDWTEGKRLVGFFQLRYRNVTQLNAANLKSKVQIRAYFKGTAYPMPYIDIWPLLPYIGMLILGGLFVWSYWLRKVVRIPFNAERAKLVFLDLMAQPGWELRSKMSTVTLRSGLKAVGALVKVGDDPEERFVAEIDNRLQVQDEYWPSPDTWKMLFEREGLEYRRKIEETEHKHTKADVEAAFKSGRQYEQSSRLGKQGISPEQRAKMLERATDKSETRPAEEKIPGGEEEKVV